jgi:hypothetical protein
LLTKQKLDGAATSPCPATHHSDLLYDDPLPSITTLGTPSSTSSNSEDWIDDNPVNSTTSEASMIKSNNKTAAEAYSDGQSGEEERENIDDNGGLDQDEISDDDEDEQDETEMIKTYRPNLLH